MNNNEYMKVAVEEANINSTFSRCSSVISCSSRSAGKLQKAHNAASEFLIFVIRFLFDRFVSVGFSGSGKRFSGISGYPISANRSRSMFTAPETVMISSARPKLTVSCGDNHSTLPFLRSRISRK